MAECVEQLSRRVLIRKQTKKLFEVLRQSSRSLQPDNDGKGSLLIRQDWPEAFQITLISNKFRKVDEQISLEAVLEKRSRKI